MRVKVRNRREVSRAAHTCGLFYCFKWMCIFLAQGTAQIPLSTWRSLHVSPVPTTFASRGNLKTQNSHGQEPCGAESDLHCLGDRGRWAVGCYICEQGRGLAMGDGSIREGENSVASLCRVEHLEQLCWNPSTGTLGCPASRQPAGCWGCTARGPCSSFMNAQHFLMRHEH